MLEARGLWERLQGRIVQGQDIGQTFAFVFSRNADLGLVACSQLVQPGQASTVSVWLVPQNLYEPIAQQAVMLVDTPAAREFISPVRSRDGREIIRTFGYEP